METVNPCSETKADRLIMPFRYPGNIIYALGSLLPLIPTHESYIEPFCGGASTFFAKNKTSFNWLNDIDSELIEAYEAIRDNPGKLLDFIEKEESSAERHHFFQIEFAPCNSLERAMRWFYLNRTSRIDTMSMLWEPDPALSLRSENWSQIIFECSKKLEGVKLTCGDFEKTISNAPRGAFLFVAPPYSIHHSPEKTRLHKYPFERESHFRLARALKEKVLEVKFMITYNDNDEIKRLYSWGENISIINLPNKPPLKEEIVIMNYRA